MFSDAKLYSMYQIANTPVRAYPFQHLYVENIFPPALYSEMRRLLPANSDYKRLADTGRVTGYSQARLCLFPNDIDGTALDHERKTFWTTFFNTYLDQELVRMWISTFGSTISERMTSGGVQEKNPGGKVSISTEIFLVRDLQSFALKPHTDTPRKILTVLYYLPPDDTYAVMGTSIYRPKDAGFSSNSGRKSRRDDFDLVTTLPYRANCAVSFARTDTSFHGVEALDVPSFERDLIIFDLKFTDPDSF